MELPLSAERLINSYRVSSRWEWLLSPPRGGFFVAGFCRRRATQAPPLSIHQERANRGVSIMARGPRSNVVGFDRTRRSARENNFAGRGIGDFRPFIAFFSPLPKMVSELTLYRLRSSLPILIAIKSGCHYSRQRRL